MVVQCRMCKRIRVDGDFRLPWMGELSEEITETYCPHCAEETLKQIQNGDFERIARRRMIRKAGA